MVFGSQRQDDTKKKRRAQPKMWWVRPRPVQGSRQRVSPAGAAQPQLQPVKWGSPQHAVVSRRVKPRLAALKNRKSNPKTTQAFAEVLKRRKPLQNQ